MKRVLKFTLPVDDNVHTINMPDSGTILLGVQQRLDVVCLWEIDGGRPWRCRRLRVFGTGQPIPDDARYVGSTQAGPLVWHVFEMSIEGQVGE